MKKKIKNVKVGDIIDGEPGPQCPRYKKEVEEPEEKSIFRMREYIGP